MIQPLTGVNPNETREITIMTVWPSVAAFALGRLLGRAYSISAGTYIFTVGNLIALLSIPIALVLYLMRVAPFIGTRYTVTNRRVVVQKGLQATNDHWVDLDRFDSVELVVRPGQQWFDAGDLIFSKDGVETFQLVGVSRPEAFRRMCLNAHLAHVGVEAALAQSSTTRSSA